MPDIVALAWHEAARNKSLQASYKEVFPQLICCLLTSVTLLQE